MKKPRRKWTRPANPWNAAELASLHIPVDAVRRKEFASLYRQKTGYAMEELMPLAFALMLITGAHQPTRATEIAVRYLMAGIPTFPHRDKEVLKRGEMELVTRQFRLEEAIEYLAQNESGLRAWQFVQLANSLAAAKLAIRRKASTKNLGATKMGKTKIA